MRTIPLIKRGEPIRARYLSSMAEAINDTARKLARIGAQVDQQLRRSGQDGSNLDPQQLAEPEARIADPEIGLSDGAIYVEAGRSVTTVRVENPSDSAQYVDVERIRTVTLVAADGKILQLQFDV